MSVMEVEEDRGAGAMWISSAMKQGEETLRLHQ
jgi:hypothetical protein